MSYEGSNDEEDLEMVPVVNQNTNYFNVISVSKSKSENNEAKCFSQDIHKKVKATPNTTINAKMVQTMKKLQASYNKDANKNVE